MATISTAEAPHLSRRSGGVPLMAKVLGVAYLAGLISIPALAGSWSGTLIDSQCYNSNLNPREPPASRNTGLAIQHCAPNSGTKSFAVVAKGHIYNLDSAGNEKAAGLLTK